jgi:hypothetical protein
MMVFFPFLILLSSRNLHFYRYLTFNVSTISTSYWWFDLSLPFGFFSDSAGFCELSVLNLSFSILLQVSLTHVFHLKPRVYTNCILWLWALFNCNSKSSEHIWAFWRMKQKQFRGKIEWWIEWERPDMSLLSLKTKKIILYSLLGYLPILFQAFETQFYEVLY